MNAIDRLLSEAPAEATGVAVRLLPCHICFFRRDGATFRPAPDSARGWGARKLVAAPSPFGAIGKGPAWDWAPVAAEIADGAAVDFTALEWRDFTQGERDGDA